MSFDNYFTSSYKSHGVQSRKIVAAKVKRGWPVGAQYQRKEETMELWMKWPNGKSFHVRNLTPEESREEMRLWRENNPGWQFGLKEKESRHVPGKKIEKNGKAYGTPRKQWD